MTNSSMNDKYDSFARAVTAAVNGEQEAFRYLYEATYHDKYYIALKYMGNESDAQDVLQEAYLKAWQSLAQLQEPEKFPNWLSLIVANTALNTLRKKKELPFSAMEQETDADMLSFEQEDWRKEYQPEHAYTDKEVSKLLQELMNALSDEQRLCVLMYYVEEFSIKEIAQMIGCSENTVKSRLNYGRKHLKQKAEELEKKGYTLYSVAPVPLLLYLLRTQSRAFSVRIPSFAANRGRVHVKNGTGNPASAATSTAAKSAFSSLGMKIGAAALAVTIVGAGGVAVSGRMRASDTEQNVTSSTGKHANAEPTSVEDTSFETADNQTPEDRHAFLLKCIEEAGDFYYADWEEILFDDWNDDGLEDAVFYGYSQASDEYVVCIAGIGANQYDELCKMMLSSLDSISFYKIPTDDGCHLAYCYEGTDKKKPDYPSMGGRVLSFTEDGIKKEAGAAKFSNPQINAIDAYYVVFDVNGNVKDEINTTITWNGEEYIGTYYTYYTADSVYGSGLLFKEGEGPHAQGYH